VKRDRSEDDRPDRSDRGRQKVRFAAKPETPKKTCVPESDDRLRKIESEMSKVHNELKKLTAKPQAPKGNGYYSSPQWRGPVPGSLTWLRKDTSH